MKRFLFFDIDGTLVSFTNHKIPESAIYGLTLAKEKGPAYTLRQAAHTVL